MGAGGTELPPDFSGKSGISDRRDNTDLAEVLAKSADLQAIVKAWPTLDESTRRVILRLAGG